MENSPKVSIIVPLHNAADYLSDSVGSALAQTFERLEVIAVDDGSTDDTPALLEALAENDMRLHVITQTNQGPGAARNRGLQESLGEYVLFFDGDDAAKPTLVQRAYDRAYSCDADIVIYQTRHFDVQQDEYVPNPDRWDASAFPAEFNPADFGDTVFGAFRNWPWDKMFKREFLERNNIEFPALHRTEDLLFTCSALATAEKIALLDEPLYTYRVNNPTSSTQNIDHAPLDFLESATLLKEYLQQRDLFRVYAHSYANWIGLCVLVNLLGLKTPEGFALAYNALHNGGIRSLELDSFSQDEFDDPVYFQLIDVVMNQDLASGMFWLWHCDVNRKQSEHDRQVHEILTSTTFRMGNTLLKPFTKMKDARNSQV